VVRGAARHYLVLCVLRAWLDVLRCTQARKRLSQAKSRQVAAALRHSCAVLSASLRRVADRRLREVVHGLWLHAAAQRLRDTSFAGLGPGSSAGGSAWGLLHEVETLELARQSAQGLPREPPEDQVLFATPRLAPPNRDGLAPAPKRVWPSPGSEASTCAPSSRSPAATLGASCSARCVRSSSSSCAARLAVCLEAARLRRLSWSWRVLHAGQAAQQRAEAAERIAEGAREALAGTRCEEWALAARLSDLEDRRRREAEAVAAQLEAERSHCEAQASGLRRYASELGEAKEELQRHRDEDHATLARMWSEGEQVQAEVQRLQERSECEGAAASRAIEERCAESERLRVSEAACAGLEARLARQARWREEAERQILSMVSRGETLERERACLLDHCTEAQRAAEATRHSLARANEANETLRLRTHDLEKENAELLAAAGRERTGRLAQAAQQGKATALLQQELAQLRGALRKAHGSRALQEECAVEAACGDLEQAHEREREEWSRECDELRRQLQAVREECEATRCAEWAEARAAEGSWAWSSATRRPRGADTCGGSCEAMRGEAQAEMAACQRAKARLEQCVGRVEQLQEDLEEAREQGAVRASRAGHGVPPAPGCDDAGPWPSGPPRATTPQLDELDAYAELVERLRAEVRWERVEREASESSLSSLRSSYRLLLERVDAPAGRSGPG